ncbi:TPA: NTP transferase domain-containing protein [Pseudomonas aeruginosa]
MSPIEHAVISAAGIGSRLGLNKPKCLVEVGGKTLLAQHLERLAEIPNVWVVVGFQEELVIEQVRNLRRDAIIVRNPDFDRTNTLQSIHRVSRYLDRRFLAVDGDTFIENRSFERFLRAAAGQAGLIGVSRYTTSDGVRVLLDAWRGGHRFHPRAAARLRMDGYRDSPAGHGGGPADIRVPGARTVPAAARAGTRRLRHRYRQRPGYGAARAPE